MKTLAWLPCTVEMLGTTRLDEHQVAANVRVTSPGGDGALISVALTLRDNHSKGDEELIFMAAVSHLQADFRIPPPAPSFAAKDGAKV